MPVRSPSLPPSIISIDRQLTKSRPGKKALSLYGRDWNAGAVPSATDCNECTQLIDFVRRQKQQKLLIRRSEVYGGYTELRARRGAEIHMRKRCTTTPFVATLYCPPDSEYSSPEQFQPELNLPGSGAGGRDDPGGWGRSSSCRCIYDRIWCVEVRVIEQVEYFGAELQVQSLGK
jgi:hypothetical protein